MRRLAVVTILGIFIGLAAGWTLHRIRGRDARPGTSAQSRALRKSADPPDPVGSASRTVSVDKEAAERMGLEVSVLRPTRQAPQLRTAAIVLSPSGLGQLATVYATDTKDLAMARANFAVARNEYRRQRLLYKADQNTSLKALQAAQGLVQSSQAQTVAAQRQLQLDALGVEQAWGPVLRRWLVARTPAFEKILSQQEWLVQVTFGAGGPRSAPLIARLITPSGSVVSARLVSSFPQTNVVIQGLNFLYVIPARPGFAPGLSLVAEVADGIARSGVVIPAAAVVWSQGQAWAYEEISTGRFERLAVQTDEPTTNGWFVTTGFAPGDRIVTRAAEELFSAEAQPAAGNQGDEGDDD